MVLSQISNKFHRFQQITKQGRVNIQRKRNWKKRLSYSDFPRHICIFIYIYVCFFLLAANIHYFVNKLIRLAPVEYSNGNIQNIRNIQKL